MPQPGRDGWPQREANGEMCRNLVRWAISASERERSVRRLQRSQQPPDGVRRRSPIFIRRRSAVRSCFARSLTFKPIGTPRRRWAVSQVCQCDKIATRSRFSPPLVTPWCCLAPVLQILFLGGWGMACSAVVLIALIRTIAATRYLVHPSR
jgi:hypothetical protein